MSPVTLISFAGCPVAPRVREVLRRSAVPYEDVRQDVLPEGHPLRGYTSPTVLAGERVLFGGRSDAAGCSIAPLDEARLLAELQDAARP